MDINRNWLVAILGPGVQATTDRVEWRCGDVGPRLELLHGDLCLGFRHAEDTPYRMTSVQQVTGFLKMTQWPIRRVSRVGRRQEMEV